MDTAWPARFTPLVQTALPALPARVFPEVFVRVNMIGQGLSEADCERHFAGVRFVVGSPKPVDELRRTDYKQHMSENSADKIGAAADLEEQSPLPQAAHLRLEPGAPTDIELMQGIQAEDPDALSRLYDRYNGILKALILRVIHNETEADDLLQEIFMEIWNQAKNFSPDKGKPLGWMVTLARRRAIDGLRKKQAYARAEERLQVQTEQQPDAWVHNATEEEIAFSDTRFLIRRVIERLPVAQQEAVELAFFRGMSQREIAAKTNTPLGTVKTRLELGLKKIYDGLKELKDEL